MILSFFFKKFIDLGGLVEFKLLVGLGNCKASQVWGWLGALVTGVQVRYRLVTSENVVVCRAHWTQNTREGCGLAIY